MTRKLLYTGIGFISFSVVFIIVVYSTFLDISQLISTFAASLIGSAGVALIIIALIEREYIKGVIEQTSNRIVDVVRNTSNEIVKTTTYNLDDKFKKTFEILEHAEYNGLVDILAPRLDRKRGEEYTKKIIANEIKKSKSVRVFGMYGLDFFGSFGGGGSVFTGLYFRAIQERIDDAKKENKPLDLEIRALLMDPNSEAAKFRDQIESFNGRRLNIQRLVDDAKGGIQELNRLAGKNFIEYRLYSIFPQVGLVLTDSFVFIEIYHYAPTKELCDALIEKGLEATTLATPCTCGRVPILQFSSNSNMYVAMQKHFDSIWKYEEEKQKQNKSAA